MPIKIIDLFAGPGGLGEGFSAFRLNGQRKFKIAISIEKEKSAHRTLLLRALFRQFEPNQVPEAYYAFLRGELGTQPEDQLYQLDEIKDALTEAIREAKQLTLGEDNAEIYENIRDVIGQDECVLIGGPPCQAYSFAGRSRNYGDKVKNYSAVDDHRNFLYREYLQVIAKFQPKVFVMENVKGILSAKVDGRLIFESITNDLKDPCTSTGTSPEGGREEHTYHVVSLVPRNGTCVLDTHDDHHHDPHDFIIRAEKYGIPQTRHRVILLGIRSDLFENLGAIQALTPTTLTPSVKQAISDLPSLRSRLSKVPDSTEAWRSAVKSFSDDSLFMLDNDEAVPTRVYDQCVKQISTTMRSPASHGANAGVKKSSTEFDNDLTEPLKVWYSDARLGRYVLNHESRGHITADLHRYLYYSTYAKVQGSSPTAKTLPKVLWPAHKNFNSGKFADRFRVQLSDNPGTTVTSHISKDGHYFIHYDPTQCRSFTVREAARIQTFPDNYYFVGNRTEQYVQVGNAVPPYLARQIAETVNALLI